MSNYSVFVILNSDGLILVMLSSKKLALLVCGALPPPLLDIYGDYGRIYRQFLLNALPDDTPFTLDPYDVVYKMEYPADNQIDSYDGVIYTGSGTYTHNGCNPSSKFIQQLPRPTRT